MTRVPAAGVPAAGVPGRRLALLAFQFARYVVVGGVAFVADAGTLWVLTEVAGVHYLVSNVGGFAVGLLVNYLLSVRWVFARHSGRPVGVEIGVFAAIGVAGLGLNEVLLWAATEGIGLHYMLSKVLAAGVVLVWNFGARRWFLFRG